MVLPIREVETIETALIYLRANRDDVLSALSHEDDDTGEIVCPAILSEEDIGKLLERIEEGNLTLAPLAVMTIYVAYVGGKPKGILTAKEYEKNSNPWWDSIQPKEVPTADFNAGRISIATINQY